MEGPEGEGETNEGTTNPSMEPSASAEPMLLAEVTDGIHQKLPPLPRPEYSEHPPLPQPETSVKSSPRLKPSPSPQPPPGPQSSAIEPQHAPVEDFHMKDEPLADPVLRSDALSSSDDLTPPPDAGVQQSQTQTALSSELSDLESDVYE